MFLTPVSVAEPMISVLFSLVVPVYQTAWQQSMLFTGKQQKVQQQDLLRVIPPQDM